MLKILDKYDYKFPSDLIAQKPAAPRDSSRLLIYSKKSDALTLDVFLNLDKYLPKGAVLVFNKTKVVPARLVLKKPSGGKVQILYLETRGGLIRVMANQRLEEGMVLKLNSKINFTVGEKAGKYYDLLPSFKIEKLFAVLEKYGKTPIPPYIKNSPLTEKGLREKYQTIFAEERGSVAAPTASLHFTERLFKRLKNKGFGIEFVTLHVNLGTFAPLTEENLKTGRLHKEYFEIDKKTAGALNKAKQQGRPIIAVGTTSIRTLEYVAKNEKLKASSGITDLFIREGYKFKFIDGMITNFHVPKSSLMMLVAAFIGRKNLLKLYRYVINQKFRFFSFGDGMLVY
ncbi:MAG: S-adenosylmethionine:tRNA ribosyltransferase-isomerase [Parcubacteria group bacterium GW2011_GWA2_39_18]|nr:MAG: S-adenosylmethionine:tRNA ribosyltransferase-isomerase [Parcubacteria group bacterium GW2011_GWA2_39_18]